MFALFYEKGNFNEDIGGWDVSKVTNMGSMFMYAAAFDQDISNWDVSEVTNMNSMFNSATAMNQNLSPWCVDDFSNGDYYNYGFGNAGADPIWGAACRD